MFEAMRQARSSRRVTMDPTAISAMEALEMATSAELPRSPAPATDRSNQASVLADIIIVGMSKPRQQPLFDPVSQIVYASRGDDVETTIVNGRILMRDRKVLTLNEASVLAEARKAADLVRKAVGQ